MVLKPLSSLYGGLLDLRNSLYDAGWLASFTPSQCCLSVGNLTVGGTGKTPAVTYLLRYLLNVDPALTGELATLSRGYGRKTRGFRLATPTDTAETLGDEPLQLYQTFGDQVTVVVDERRSNALQHLAAEQPAIGTVVLDDAFQHRAVRPHLNLLLMDYNRPFYRDEPFPGGRLRERRHGARRADAVIVTKCPHDPTPTERADMTAQIRRYARPAVPVWFAGLRYDTPRRFGTQAPHEPNAPVLLVSGLADARPLEQYVRDTWGLVLHVAYGDHHPYTRADVDQLLGTLPTGHTLLTTEKDRVKLAALLTPDELAARPLAYLPVAMQFWQEADATALASLVLGTLKNR
ncbi:tetraacyldisaccharide 4'-kinase [Fibrella aestuarina BUZ 2]|uniref:Tetraacyldisaccharide 4'-kinase n=1 Tax=Fibrella aestuarina BUZ 2 TaxID=1166018 RepID=I0KB14_9BACT|nr:tetraacyldisaccharide 4'-kinase [Fibrella aestuarina]CCH01317.1 tetraacyldisaccharide 4'-kinase [Fibrella aestuarina BUZ 2]